MITRPDGATIGLGYDVARRLETITSPRGTTTITYDPGTGHVASLTTPEGNGLHYEMDGPLVTKVTWTGEVEGSVERTYDANLRVTSISVNNANPIAYTYDDDGLLVQAGDLVLTRDPATGLLTDTALGVVTTHYDYDDFGGLEAMSASVSGTPIFETDYVRDKLGRITTKTEMIEGVTKVNVYGYDPAGRLDTVTIDGVLSADYDYDANGNRLQKWTLGGTEAGTYDDQDRLLTYAGASYGYTRNGELQSKTDGDGTTTYDYDVFDNLLGVDLPDGTQIDYTVDARNRRIGRREDGAWTQKLLWQSQLGPVAELDAANAVVSRFVTATRVNVPDYMIRGGQTYRILTDHLGSPRLIVDVSDGGLVQRTDYDEWGVVVQDTNPGWMPFGFAGGINSTATGDVRFGLRDYASGLGRWLLKDPIVFQGQSANLFEYSGSDPLNLVDRNGLDPQPTPGTPIPPGWNPSWEWRYPEGTSPSEPRWFDPNGEEWRWHAPDKWHPEGHWDHNPWDDWNSPWENVPAEPACPRLPESEPPPSWWKPFLHLVPDPLPIIINPCLVGGLCGDEGAPTRWDA